MEWLHDWIVVSKRIVQKYTIEALHVDRNALKKKYRNSLSSPVTDEMRRPSAFRNSMAEVLRAPRFSTTIGWKMWCCWRSMYLTDFLSAAFSATRPDSLVATCSDVRIDQCTYNRDITNQRLTVLPRDQWKPVWPFVYYYYFLNPRLKNTRRWNKNLKILNSRWNEH